MNLIKNQSFDLDLGVKKERLIFAFFENIHSKHTKRAYMGDIKDFLLFSRRHFFSISFLDIDFYHATQYQKHLISYYKSKTVNRRIGSISKFYKYLKDFKYIKENPFEKIERVKENDISHTESLSVEEVEKIINSCDLGSNSGILHFALLNLLFYRGMRRSEIVSLKIKDFDFDEKAQVFYLSYINKGGERIHKKINEKCVDALYLLLDKYKEEGYSLSENDYLFRPFKNNVSKDFNKPINGASLYYIVTKYTRMAKIDKKVTPHSFRASMICYYLDRYPTHLVQKEVEHKHIETTQGYDQRKRSLEKSIVD